MKRVGTVSFFLRRSNSRFFGICKKSCHRLRVICSSKLRFLANFFSFLSFRLLRRFCVQSFRCLSHAVHSELAFLQQCLKRLPNVFLYVTIFLKSTPQVALAGSNIRLLKADTFCWLSWPRVGFLLIIALAVLFFSTNCANDWLLCHITGNIGVLVIISKFLLQSFCKTTI